MIDLYNPKSSKAEEFINHEEILSTLAYADEHKHDKALITEILAKNAVNAVEQVAKETGIKGADKLAEAKAAMLNELEKYNVYMTDKDLDVFIESAVKKMNDNWKGK